MAPTTHCKHFAPCKCNYQPVDATCVMSIMCRGSPRARSKVMDDERGPSCRDGTTSVPAAETCPFQESAQTLVQQGFAPFVHRTECKKTPVEKVIRAHVAVCDRRFANELRANSNHRNSRSRRSRIDPKNFSKKIPGNPPTGATNRCMDTFVHESRASTAGASAGAIVAPLVGGRVRSARATPPWRVRDRTYRHR